MMNTSSLCLRSEQVQCLLDNDVLPEDLAGMEEHLSSCASCRLKVERAIGDPDWWQEARESLDPNSTIHLDSSYQPAEPHSDILQLLGPTDDPQMLGRIGTYEIVGVLGRGGMGVVFKGFDSALNRYVAIKMLAPHLAASGAARKRFEREAQAAAAVVHDHVMAIHGVADWKNVPYLVMPYVRGASLQKRIDDQGPLLLREILRIGMQTAAGLAAAHAQGLVHRDVKPANIMLASGVERVTLTDFGLARAVDDATLTRTGTLAGTPQYMSPEQARGQAVDFRSDLFSLGSVLYTLCTGRPPFRAETSYGILRLITDEEPRPIQQLNSDIPIWLCTIIGRLMAKEPQQRYSSAEEVSTLLEACLAHVEQPALVQLPAQLVPPPPKKSSLLQSFTKLSFPRKLLAVVAGLIPLVIGSLLALAATNPPDIAGDWNGENWGNVVLKMTQPGQYNGTFSDTVSQEPGTLEVKWSRIERSFNGTWKEADARFGELSLSLSGEEIRGALTTDDKSKINPGTPRLATLTWKRGHQQTPVINPNTTASTPEAASLPKDVALKDWYRADPFPEIPPTTETFPNILDAYIINNSLVQAELKLSAKEIEVIQGLLNPLLVRAPGQPIETANSFQAAKLYAADIKSLLNLDQLNRVEQLRVQHLGYRAIVDSRDLATVDQKQKINLEHQQYKLQMLTLLKEQGSNPPPTEVAVHQEMELLKTVAGQKHLAELWNDIYQILTPEQRTSFDAIRGPALASSVANSTSKTSTQTEDPKNNAPQSISDWSTRLSFPQAGVYQLGIGLRCVAIDNEKAEPFSRDCGVINIQIDEGAARTLTLKFDAIPNKDSQRIGNWQFHLLQDLNGKPDRLRSFEMQPLRSKATITPHLDSLEGFNCTHEQAAPLLTLANEEWQETLTLTTKFWGLDDKNAPRKDIILFTAEKKSRAAADPATWYIPDPFPELPVPAISEWIAEYLQLVSQPAVQQAVDLNPYQAFLASQLKQPFRSLSSEAKDRFKTVDALGLHHIISDQQQTLLTYINRQRYGTRVFVVPEVTKQLGLTHSQCAAIVQAIEAQQKSAAQNLGSPPLRVPPPSLNPKNSINTPYFDNISLDSIELNRALVGTAEQQDACWKQIYDILTPQQRDQFVELRGFKVDRDKYRPVAEKNAKDWYRPVPFPELPPTHLSDRDQLLKDSQSQPQVLRALNISQKEVAKYLLLLLKPQRHIRDTDTRTRAQALTVFQEARVSQLYWQQLGYRVFATDVFRRNLEITPAQQQAIYDATKRFEGGLEKIQPSSEPPAPSSYSLAEKRERDIRVYAHEKELISRPEGQKLLEELWGEIFATLTPEQRFNFNALRGPAFQNVAADSKEPLPPGSNATDAKQAFIDALLIAPWRKPGAHRWVDITGKSPGGDGFAPAAPGDGMSWEAKLILKTAKVVRVTVSGMRWDKSNENAKAFQVNYGTALFAFDEKQNREDLFLKMEGASASEKDAPRWRLLLQDRKRGNDYPIHSHTLDRDKILSVHNNALKEFSCCGQSSTELLDFQSKDEREFIQLEVQMWDANDPTAPNPKQESAAVSDFPKGLSDWYRPDPFPALPVPFIDQWDWAFVQLAMDPGFQTSLNISALGTPEQLTAIAARQNLLAVKPLDNAALWQEQVRALTALYSAEHNQRLKQILWQRYGYRAFLVGAMPQILELTEKQKRDIYEIIDSHQRKVQESSVAKALPQPSQPVPSPLSSVDERRLYSGDTAQQMECWNKIREILTPKQQVLFIAERGPAIAGGNATAATEHWRHPQQFRWLDLSAKHPVGTSPFAPAEPGKGIHWESKLDLTSRITARVTITGVRFRDRKREAPGIPIYYSTNLFKVDDATDLKEMYLKIEGASANGREKPRWQLLLEDRKKKESRPLAQHFLDENSVLRLANNSAHLFPAIGQSSNPVLTIQDGEELETISLTVEIWKEGDPDAPKQEVAPAAAAPVTDKATDRSSTIVQVGTEESSSEFSRGVNLSVPPGQVVNVAIVAKAHGVSRVIRRFHAVSKDAAWVGSLHWKLERPPVPAGNAQKEMPQELQESYELGLANREDGTAPTSLTTGAPLLVVPHLFNPMKMPQESAPAITLCAPFIGPSDLPMEVAAGETKEAILFFNVAESGEEELITLRVSADALPQGITPLAAFHHRLGSSWQVLRYPRPESEPGEVEVLLPWQDDRLEFYHLPWSSEDHIFKMVEPLGIVPAIQQAGQVNTPDFVLEIPQNTKPQELLSQLPLLPKFELSRLRVRTVDAKVRNLRTTALPDKKKLTEELLSSLQGRWSCLTASDKDFKPSEYDMWIDGDSICFIEKGKPSSLAKIALDIGHTPCRFDLLGEEKMKGALDLKAGELTLCLAEEYPTTLEPSSKVMQLKFRYTGKLAAGEMPRTITKPIPVPPTEVKQEEAPIVAHNFAIKSARTDRHILLVDCEWSQMVAPAWARTLFLGPDRILTAEEIKQKPEGYGLVSPISDWPVNANYQLTQSKQDHRFAFVFPHPELAQIALKQVDELSRNGDRTIRSNKVVTFFRVEFEGANYQGGLDIRRGAAAFTNQGIPVQITLHAPFIFTLDHWKKLALLLENPDVKIIIKQASKEGEQTLKASVRVDPKFKYHDLRSIMDGLKKAGISTVEIQGGSGSLTDEHTDAKPVEKAAENPAAAPAPAPPK